MAFITVPFTGFALVPAYIALYSNSAIPGYFTYYDGPTAVSSYVTYSVAANSAAVTYAQEAVVTANFVLPATATNGVYGQIQLYSGASSTQVGLYSLQAHPTQSATQNAAQSSSGNNNNNNNGNNNDNGNSRATSSSSNGNGRGNSNSSRQSGATSTSSTRRNTATGSSSSNSSGSSGSYGTGSLAGVAIGCFLVGLLLASILAFFFFRRRSAARRGTLPTSASEKSSLNGHGQAVYIAGEKAWEKHLPQSESDNTIRSLASRTLDQIELHVENYYRDATATPLNFDMRSKIENLDAGHLDKPMLLLFQQTERPTALIKHCVASLVISKITAGSGSTDDTFLPAEFMAISPPLDNRDTSAYIEAISKWRVLTAYLRSKFEYAGHYQQRRDRAIAESAQRVCEAFGPWAFGDNKVRLESIVNIMTRASEFGVTMFAQPASFEWQWSDNSRGRRENSDTQIVALPGLNKTTDQDSQPLAPKVRLVEPRMGSLGN